MEDSEDFMGYNYAELAGRSIRDIMPKTVADVHFMYL